MKSLSSLTAKYDHELTMMFWTARKPIFASLCWFRQSDKTVQGGSLVITDKGWSIFWNDLQGGVDAFQN